MNQQVFDLHTAKWIQERTVGNPPLGIRGQACAAVGSDMYFFGGFCGHDWCRHNSVYCLDTLINVWREVIPINPAMNPMKKSRCGMFHFRMEGVDYLCVVGGTGLLCSANQTDATYIPWRENPDWGWTDEHHILALNNGNGRYIRYCMCLVELNELHVFSKDGEIYLCHYSSTFQQKRLLILFIIPYLCSIDSLYMVNDSFHIAQHHPYNEITFHSLLYYIYRYMDSSFNDGRYCPSLCWF